MNRTGLSIAAAALVFAAQAASAATYYDFTQGGAVTYADALSVGPMTITGEAAQNGTAIDADVSRGFHGLGVATPGDTMPHLLDGAPVGAYEALRISFAYAVTLNNLTFGRMELGDDYALSINGGPAVSYDLAFLELGLTGVTSLVVSVLGEAGETSGRADEFTLKAIEIASVPVPAAGGMMLLGLGALAALRRRH